MFISQVLGHTMILRLKANPGLHNVHNSKILHLIRLKRRNMVVQHSGISIQEVRAYSYSRKHHIAARNILRIEHAKEGQR